MLTADVGIYSISRLPGCPMSSSSSSSSCWLCYCVFVFLALSQWGRGTGELLHQVKSHTASPYIIMLPIHQSCRLGVLSSWSHDLFVFFLPHAPPQMCMGQKFVTKSSFHLFFCLHTIFFFDLPQCLVVSCSFAAALVLFSLWHKPRSTHYLRKRGECVAKCPFLCSLSPLTGNHISIHTLIIPFDENWVSSPRR